MIAIIILFCFVLCSEDQKTKQRNCNLDIDSIDFTFGIDYTDPNKYLIPGDEPDLSDTYLQEVTNSLGEINNNIADILLVCHWVNQNFTFENRFRIDVIRILHQRMDFERHL